MLNDGQARCHFTHVSDIAAAIVTALSHSTAVIGPRAFNLGKRGLVARGRFVGARLDYTGRAR